MSCQALDALIGEPRDRRRFTVPSEYDASFRKRSVWGEAHDEKAV